MSRSDRPRARALGGIFFRCEDPAATRAWYEQHLGLKVDAYGTNFAWRDRHEPERIGRTQWSPFKQGTDYFGDPEQQFMINYRVDDLDALLEQMRQQGVEIVGDVQVESYGKFAHVIDGDGRRIELWEPVDEVYQEMVDGETD